MATFISAIQVENGVSTYTIPADATGVLIGFAFDSGTNGSTLTSCSLTGCGAFTVVSQVPTVSGTFERCAGWAWADVSLPGSSKTFTATLSAGVSQGPHYVAVFVKHITAGAWVQDGASDNRDASNAPSVTADSTTTSLAFAMDAKFNAAPGVASGWTGLVAIGNILSQFAQVSSADSPGAATTNFTSPSPDYSAASIVTLLGSGGGGGASRVNMFDRRKQFFEV